MAVAMQVFWWPPPQRQAVCEEAWCERVSLSIDVGVEYVLFPKIRTWILRPEDVPRNQWRNGGVVMIA